MYITALNREKSHSRSSETYSLPHKIYLKAWRTRTHESSCIHAFVHKKLVKYFKKSSVPRHLPEDWVTQELQFANTHMSLWSGRDWNVQFRHKQYYTETLTSSIDQAQIDISIGSVNPFGQVGKSTLPYPLYSGLQQTPIPQYSTHQDTYHNLDTKLRQSGSQVMNFVPSCLHVRTSR